MVFTKLSRIQRIAIFFLSTCILEGVNPTILKYETIYVIQVFVYNWTIKHRSRVKLLLTSTQVMVDPCIFNVCWNPEKACYNFILLMKYGKNVEHISNKQIHCTFTLIYVHLKKESTPSFKAFKVFNDLSPTVPYIFNWFRNNWNIFN